jgi:hypothetical protein
LALLCRATNGRCLLSLMRLPLLICVRWPVDTMHFCPNSKHFPLNTLENTIIVIWTQCEELRCSCYPPPWPLGAVSLRTRWQQCSKTTA